MKKAINFARGFAPKLTDAEVITMEICGEFFKIHEDTGIYKYFKRHYLHFFPNLPDRTTFVRQSANLWQAKLWCQMFITAVSDQRRDPVQSIDTLPLPVCTYRAAEFGTDAFGRLPTSVTSAAKKMDYYGFKLGLRIARSGMITHFPLLSARDHDINHLGALIENFAGTTPADKGFLDAYQTELWQEKQHTRVVTPHRKNMESSPEQVQLVRRTKYWRKLIETVGSQ